MSKKVCVITGGGSGIGLAVARVMAKEYTVIISGRTVSKLSGVKDELKDEGIEIEYCRCDVSDLESVKSLAVYGEQFGEIEVVIHGAGLSPNMGNSEKLIDVNAIGTINVHTVFSKIIKDGGCLINVSSMSAYMLPNLIIPTKIFKYSLDSVEKFRKKILRRVSIFPKKQRTGVAYCFSKAFVIWFSKAQALELGSKKIRVLSVSPGNFETPMGELEKDEGSKFLEKSALGRFGIVDEIAYLISTLSDNRNGYLTGVDILCDGGTIAGQSLKV